MQPISTFKLFLIIFLLFTISFSNASTITSQATGNWGSASSWAPISRTGTISVTSGSKNVTGVGTSFTTELAVGSILYQSDGITLIGTVASITDATHLTLVANAPSTLSTQAYTASVVPTSSDDVIIASGTTVTVDVNAFANSVSVSGTLNINDATQLTVYNNFTVNSSGSFNMPTSPASAIATLLVYGDFLNNGATDFWKSNVIIGGNFTTTTTALQNNGNIVVGGNIVGNINLTGGTGASQIYPVNPNATITITPTSLDNNVVAGTYPSGESAALQSLVNTVIYGGTCPFTVNTVSNVSACTGSNVVFTVTTNATSPTYQWQVNKNDGTGWSNLTNVAPYSTVTSSSLNISNVTSAINNYQYRAKVTSSSCTKSGNQGVLTVNPYADPSVSISSNGTTICSGNSVTFTPTPTYGGTSPTYQWRLNGSNIATGSTYTTTTLANNDVVSCVMTSNYSCLNSTSTATSNNITISTISGSGSWSGSFSTNWNTTTNWCSGAKPLVTTNVTFSSGYFNAPLISTNAAVCNNLTINSGATLTVNGNTLAVGGNLVINSGGNLIISSSTVTVSGSITVNLGGTLTITSPGALSASGNIVNNGTISGTGTMTLNGLLGQTISGTGYWGNVTLNNLLGCTVSSAVTISGVLTLTSGQLSSNGNLTVNLNTGAIDGSGSGTISGNITTIKTINSYKYHMVSSPLSGRTLADWNDNETINSGSFANFYSYDETNTDTSKTVGWTSQTSLSTPLTSLQGFAYYFSGVKSLDETGTYTHSSTYSNSGLTNTVSTVGTSHNAASDGWNLVGNPYPSALDWSAASGWTKTGLDNAIYCWDAANSRYTSYVAGIGTNGGTQYIPSMQGFWVKVSSPGTGTLSMTNSVRVTSTNPAIWRSAGGGDDILRLTANNGTYIDETVIRFKNDALDTFDNEIDAYKMNNEDFTPSLYTELHNDQYSINSLPYTSYEKPIPVKLLATFNGIYTFTANTTGISSADSVIFEDKLLGVKQNLRTKPDYSCSIIAGDTSSRFFISFRKGNVSGLNLNPTLPSSMIINTADGKINIQFLNENSNRATIGIYSSVGTQVFKVENADISSKEYSVQSLNVPNGIYIIKVFTDSQISTRKVYLTK